jgi:hypothetical protein
VVQVWIGKAKKLWDPQAWFIECAPDDGTMGRRDRQGKQEPLWIAHTELPRTVAHPLSSVFHKQCLSVIQQAM